MVKTLKYLYRVELGNVRHHVTKDRTCLEHGSECPAILAVADYLRAGGQRCQVMPDVFVVNVHLDEGEEEKPDAHWYIPPPRCLVCGSEIEIEKRYLSGGHDTFWKCKAGGSLHFWQAKANVLIALQRANPRTELYPGLTLKECDEFREKYKDRRYVDSAL